jgi:outer membrane protein assembly factor BamD (BamD/ComL family)
LQASKPADYEQETTEKAIKEFEDFINEDPPEDLKEEAEKAVLDLKHKKAKHDYDIAKYYESAKEYKSALIYYKSVINAYPDTEWAKLSKEKIKSLEAKINKK